MKNKPYMPLTGLAALIISHILMIQAYLEVLSFFEKGILLAGLIVSVLISICVGLKVGMNICRDTPVNFNSVGKMAILVAIFDAISLTLIFTLTVNLIITPLLFLLAALGSFFRAALYPVIKHSFSHKQDQVYSLSIMLVLNVSCILGIVLGSSLVRIVSVEYALAISSILALSLLTLLTNKRIATTLITIGIAFTAHTTHNQKDYLITTLAASPKGIDDAPDMVMRNKHGITHSFTHPVGYAIVYQNNEFLFNTNTNIFNNINNIDRAYLLSSLNDRRQNALVVGMGMASYAAVLLQNPNFEQITIVENNPAFLTAVESDLLMREVLSDKRIKIIMGDELQWVDNSAVKFDIITVAENKLTSHESIKSLYSKLKNDGILLMHTEAGGSVDKHITHVFDHHKAHFGTTIASKTMLKANPKTVKKNICSMKMGDTFIFPTKIDCKIAAEISIQAIPLPN